MVMRTSGVLPWRKTCFRCRCRVRHFASVQDGSRRRQHASFKDDFIRYSDEVREALESGKPVVALETAIYTHGFPSPENMELAVNLENKIREHGAVPATIAVVDGEPRVGLGYKGLYRLLQVAERGKALKLSRRDLPHILGMKSAGKILSGGTTVSGTMILAHLAGIEVFATGGIGGVHVGGESSLDISADLRELGRTPVAVVSSGCKSFLDIPRTLEYLETEGVGVATFADKTEDHAEFPAFWSRKSGVRSPSTIYNTKEAAAIIYAQSLLSMSSGLLFANPIPASSEIPRSEMEGIITTAVDEARSAGVVGRDNTPFILKRINELTDGKSLTANKALVESNAVTAARIAVKLADIRKDAVGERNRFREPLPASTPRQRNSTPPFGARRSFSTIACACEEKSEHNSLRAPLARKRRRVDVTVAGSISLDTSCDLVVDEADRGSAAAQPLRHTSNRATISQTVGGVGYNIAKAIRSLHPHVKLCTLVGRNDDAGSHCSGQLKETGLGTRGVRGVGTIRGSTARYVAINDGNKNLVMAMADMSILETLGGEYLPEWEQQLRDDRPKWLVLDANWDAATLRGWIVAGKAVSAQVLYEPVSVVKAARLFRADAEAHPMLRPFPENGIDIATPNEAELVAMHNAAKESGHLDEATWRQDVYSIGLPKAYADSDPSSFPSAELIARGVPQMSIDLLPYVPCVITKLGAEGVLLTKLVSSGDPLLSSSENSRFLSGWHSGDRRGSNAAIYMRLFPPPEVVAEADVVSVNGAGDTFVGVLVAGLCKQTQPDWDLLIDCAQKGSVMTLKSKESVHPELWGLDKDAVSATLRADQSSGLSRISTVPGKVRNRDRKRSGKVRNKDRKTPGKIRYC